MSEPFPETAARPVVETQALGELVGAAFVERSAFWVLLDGEAPGLSHGVDVDEDGNGFAPGTAALTSSCASATRSASGRWRSVPRVWHRGVRGHVRVARDSDIPDSGRGIGHC
jgi:hypothetical protein